MAKLTSVLQERFKKKEQPKMGELAEKTAAGQLTAFSGVFGTPRIDEQDRSRLNELLLKYANEEQQNHISTDLTSLLEITSEVKAINNQAALLHGERIKKAQVILKNYREGAFSAWLKTTYGNRQTPYNFLQYYDFYKKIPHSLHRQIEAMPRQAVYTLASREGNFSKKEEIVRNYKGETKQEMVSLIRTIFPLEEDDRRGSNRAEGGLKLLQQLSITFKNLRLSSQQKSSALQWLELIKKEIEG